VARPKKTSRVAAADALFEVRPKARIPFEFVIDELASRSPWTRPMFGCTAVYVGDKIVFILRDRTGSPADNGVWVATTKAFHASLRELLPSLRSIEVLGAGVTGWQVLPASSDDFEEAVLRACRLVLEGDPRIGKVPKAKGPSRPQPSRARRPRPPRRAR
jgi:hypothetical protein